MTAPKKYHWNHCQFYTAPQMAHIFGISESGVAARSARGELPPRCEIANTHKQAWRKIDVWNHLKLGVDIAKLNVLWANAKYLSRQQVAALSDMSDTTIISWPLNESVLFITKGAYYPRDAVLDNLNLNELHHWPNQVDDPAYNNRANLEQFAAEMAEKSGVSVRVPDALRERVEALMAQPVTPQMAVTVGFTPAQEDQLRKIFRAELSAFLRQFETELPRLIERAVWSVEGQNE